MKTKITRAKEKKGIIMKFFLALALILTAGCGSVVGPEAVVDPNATNQQDSHDDLSQPFIFEEVGEYLSGTHLVLRPLPSGFWVLADRNGTIFLLDENFGLLKKGFIGVTTYQDTGILGMAVDPDFQNNNYIYLYFTTLIKGPPCDDGPCAGLYRYVLNDGDGPLLISETEVALYPMEPDSYVHEGGGIAFGPEGNLFLGIGDGQNFYKKNESSAQDLGSPLGKVHRINLNTFDDEIISFGHRNPFTMVSTPDGLLVGDVGDNVYEEVNYIPWGADLLNFGWPLHEGPGGEFVRPIAGFARCDETYEDDDPVLHEKSYGVKFHDGVVHECGNETVTVPGYYSERDGVKPDPYGGVLSNTVLYSDIFAGYIRGFELENGQAINDRHLSHFVGVTSLVEGPDGYMYGVALFEQGKIIRLIPNPEAQE